MKHQHLWVVAGVVMTSFGSPCVRAQDGAPGDSTLEEIVVTAEKRSEDINQTNISAAAFSATDLENKGVVRIQDLANAAPGVTVATSGVINEINIRGIGLALIGPTTTSGIVNYRDGVLITHEPELQDPYFDIDHIEVLRGPQGTVAGSNSTGGAVLEVTKSPTLGGQVSGYVQQQYGSYADLATEAAVSMPVSDTLAVRLAAYNDARNSYDHWANPDFFGFTVDDRVPGDLKQQAARISVLYQPISTLSLLLKSEWDNTQTSGVAWQPSPYSAYYADSVHTPYTISYNLPDTNTGLLSWRTNLTINWAISDTVTLRSQTSYDHSRMKELDDNDGSNNSTVLPSQYISFLVPVYNTIQEFTLLSTGNNPLQWLVGVFGYDNNVFQPEFSVGATPFGNHALSGDQQAKTYAGYGQVSYQFNPLIQLQVGARWTHDLRTYLTGYSFGSPNNGYYTGHELTDKFALNITPNDDNLLYVFYARGSKPGGINTGAPDFKQEWVDDYEAGWKTAFLNKHVKTQLDGYYNDYKGIQLSVPNTAAPPGTPAPTLNGAGATIYGFEAQVQAQLGGFGADAGIANVNSSFGSAVILDQRYNLPVQLKGRNLPFAPKWSGNAGVQYDFRLANGNSVTPRLGVSYVANQYVTPFNVPVRDALGSRTLLNARLTYASGERWHIEAYGDNLANRTYLEFIDSGQAGAENDQYGAPRTYGVRARYNW